MKKHLLSIILPLALALSIPEGLFAQNSCLPEGIEFTSQSQIDNFPVNYPGCEVIEGGVLIDESISGDITNLDSLISLTSIQGSLVIWYPPALTDISGLKKLKTVGGRLLITGTHGLTDLSGLGALNFVGGYLSISINFQMESLHGLEGLTTIGGDLRIGDNEPLADLSGLEGLTSVGGDLRITYSLTLNSLKGLENLSSVGEIVQIYGNLGLTDLSALEVLDYTNIDSLVIGSNEILSVCDVKFVCDYLENGGPATIFYNAAGCNSAQEITEACQAVPADEGMADSSIRVFPNPTAGLLRVSAPDGGAEWHAAVRDAMGRTIIPLCPLVNGQIDLTPLPAGFYFLEFRTEEGVVAMRGVVKG